MRSLDTPHRSFVLGLLLLVAGRRALVATVTCFTLGHSVTLSLASLGLIGLPPAPIEAAIALSILVLAIELARERSRPTPCYPPSIPPRGRMRRCPWGMAAVFGLLHGLGFAGALAEVGLPAGEIPLALVSFNAGIEAGQLLFIAALVGLKMAADRLSVPSWVASPLAAAYVIGPLAAFWCCERTLAAIAAGG